MIEEFIHNLFSKYMVNEIKYTIKYLKEDLKITEKEQQIRQTLKMHMNMIPNKKSCHFQIGCRKEQLDEYRKENPNTFTIPKTHATGRYFIFKREDFI